MLCRVMIRGAITTQRHAARLTRAQVNPLIPDLHTFFTLLTLGMFDRLDSFDMSTTSITIHDEYLASKVFKPQRGTKSTNFGHWFRPIHHITTTKTAATVFPV